MDWLEEPKVNRVWNGNKFITADNQAVYINPSNVPGWLRGLLYPLKCLAWPLVSRVRYAKEQWAEERASEWREEYYGYFIGVRITIEVFDKVFGHMVDKYSANGSAVLLSNDMVFDMDVIDRRIYYRRIK